jgi:hypothetical protein
MRRGAASWREAALAGFAALLILLVTRWLFDAAQVIDLLVGAVAYAVALSALVGRWGGTASGSDGRE